MSTIARDARKQAERGTIDTETVLLLADECEEQEKRVFILERELNEIRWRLRQIVGGPT